MVTVVDLAMSHEYWNTINLLTSTLLLLWLMRSFRNFYRACRLRSAVISGRVVQVRGLGSYLSYLADAMPSHANHIMHTRQVEPPTGVSSVYNPYTVGKVSVSVTTGSNAYDSKLRYSIEFSTSVPCKVMAMTDVNMETLKEKVDDGGFGLGLNAGGLRSPHSGRSRSNSRSNLKDKKGSGEKSRSRSSSRASLYEESWLETLEMEDDAAGGLGMGVHGLLERHHVCHSTSRLATVDVGEHTLELETLGLNLDRFMAPNMPQPLAVPIAGAGLGDVELGNGLGVSAVTGDALGGGEIASQIPPASVQSMQSDVVFALLVIPQGHCHVDLDISPPEVAYNLALSAAGLPTTGPNQGTLTEKNPEQPSLGRKDVPAIKGRGSSSDPSPLGRTSGPDLFTSLFRNSSLRVATALSSSTPSQTAGAGAGEDTSGPNLSAIVERKGLLPRDAADISYSVLTLTGGVKKLTEIVQTARSLSSSPQSPSGASSDGAATETSLVAKDYYIGCKGRFYNTLEIFGLESDSSASTTFLQSTVLAREKIDDDATSTSDTKATAGGDSGGFDDDCVICMCDVKQIMLLPCRHFCVCPECLIKIDKCPVCRAPFDEYVAVTKGNMTGSEIVVPTLLAKKNL